MFRMSAARAVSRLEKLILRMASITGRASKAVMSTCSTVLANSSALVLGVGAFMGCFRKPIPLFPAKAGTQAFYRKAPWVSEKAWAPAFAGEGGNPGSALATRAGYEASVCAASGHGRATA